MLKSLLIDKLSQAVHAEAHVVCGGAADASCWFEYWPNVIPRLRLAGLWLILSEALISNDFFICYQKTLVS